MANLTVAEKCLIAVVVAGPALVIQAHRWIKRARAERMRRRELFQVLVVTSAERVSADHVRALTMIDLEFYGRHVLCWHVQTKAEREVCRKWRTYRDHLNRAAPTDADALARWAQTGDRLLISLLVAMSSALDYDFEDAQIGRWIDAPVVHSAADFSLGRVGRRFAELVGASRAIPTSAAGFQSAREAVMRQKAIQEELLGVLDGRHPFPLQEAVDARRAE